jgi:PAS domain S-box-containing protein
VGILYWVILYVVDGLILGRGDFAEVVLQPDSHNIWMYAILVFSAAVLGGYAHFTRRRTERDLLFTQFSIDRAADGAFWMGPDARFVYVNDAACSSLGYSRRELLSMTVHDIDPEFPAEVWLDHWREVKERGSFVIQSHHRTKDGRIFPVEVTVNYVEFEGKEYNCAFARDVTERRRAEEVLQRSETLYRTTIDSMQDAIHVVDKDLRITLFNAAFRQWNTELGLETDAVGRQVYEVFPFLPDEVRDEYIQVFKTGEILTTEETSVVGERVIATEVRKIPIVEDGDVTRVITVVRDITVRQQAARSLQEYTRRLSVLREIDQAILEARSSEEIIHAALGHIRELVPCLGVGVVLLDLETSDAQIIVGDDGARFGIETGLRFTLPNLDIAKELVATLRRGEVYTVTDLPDWPLQPVDGAKLEAADLRTAMLVPLSARGELIGLIALGIESPGSITEEQIDISWEIANQLAVAVHNTRLLEDQRGRSAELEALRQASLHLTSSLELQPVLEAILEHSRQLVSADDVHIFLFDGSRLTFGAALDANGPLEKPFAAPRQEGLTYTVARTGERIAVPDMKDHILFRDQVWEGAILGMPLRIGIQVVGVMNVAFDRPHSFSRDELRVLGLLADQAAVAIHNAHLHQQVLRHAEDLAASLTRSQELDRLRNQFIQNVSHELRSPLALILGHAELLESGELGKLKVKQKQSVAVMARRSRMLGELVQDITLILEAEANPPRLVPVALGEIAELAVGDFQIQAEEAELTLQAAIPPDLPSVRGSATYLRRVVDNLLGNALKFTPPGGSISVSARQERQTVMLQVSDTGIGIPEDKIQRIFDRFYQVDGSSSRRYGGVGLGLALVKELVDACGGDVTVESKVDQGSTFILSLPMARP